MELYACPKITTVLLASEIELKELYLLAFVILPFSFKLATGGPLNTWLVPRLELTFASDTVQMHQNTKILFITSVLMCCSN